VPAKQKALVEIGLAWAPYRSTAAWCLWRASDEGEADQGAYVAGVNCVTGRP